MRIAFISDTHLGYAWRDKELGQDSIRQAREAFLKAIDSGVDVIVHPGDVFDERVPKPEVWVEALKIFALPAMAESTGVFPVSEGVSSLPFRGVPVVAIHGNHERRGGNLKNPVEALDAAGQVVYLHANNLVLEKGGERVNIYGLGYVPESYVLDTLKSLNPKPVKNAYNIFVMHQNVKEYLPDEVSFLSLNDLPDFDLVVNGHIHSNVFEDRSKFKFMMPGSTVATQLRKDEAFRRKGFYIFDTNTEKAEFIELESTRPLLYEEFRFENSDTGSIVRDVRSKIEELLSESYSMKPVIKIKLKGSIGAGKSIDIGAITQGFEDQAIIIVDNVLESEDFKTRIEHLREMHTSKIGVETLGVTFLQKQLQELGYSGPNIEDIFEPLVEGKTEDLLTKFIKHFQHT